MSLLAWSLGRPSGLYPKPAPTAEHRVGRPDRAEARPTINDARYGFSITGQSTELGTDWSADRPREASCVTQGNRHRKDDDDPGRSSFGRRAAVPSVPRPSSPAQYARHFQETAGSLFAYLLNRCLFTQFDTMVFRLYRDNRCFRWQHERPNYRKVARADPAGPFQHQPRPIAFQKFLSPMEPWIRVAERPNATILPTPVCRKKNGARTYGALLETGPLAGESST